MMAVTESREDSTAEGPHRLPGRAGQERPAQARLVCQSPGPPVTAVLVGEGERQGSQHPVFPRRALCLGNIRLGGSHGKLTGGHRAAVWKSPELLSCLYLKLTKWQAELRSDPERSRRTHSHTLSLCVPPRPVRTWGRLGGQEGCCGGQLLRLQVHPSALSPLSRVPGGQGVCPSIRPRAQMSGDSANSEC